MQVPVAVAQGIQLDVRSRRTVMLPPVKIMRPAAVRLPVMSILPPAAIQRIPAARQAPAVRQVAIVQPAPAALQAVNV